MGKNVISNVITYPYIKLNAGSASILLVNEASWSRYYQNVEAIVHVMFWGVFCSVICV